MMKGLMVIDQISDGGAEKVFYKLYRYFSRFYMLDVYSILNTKGGWFKLNNSDRIKSSTLMYVNSNNLVGKLFLQVRFVVKLLFEVKKNKYNFLFSFLERSNVASIIVARSFNIPVIVNVRNHLTSQYQNRTTLEKFIIQKIIRVVYSRATKIVCNSFEIQKDLVDKYYINISSIIVIYNSYDLEMMSDLSTGGGVYSLCADEYKLKGGKVFVSAGRLDEQKDFITLIKTFKEHVKNFENDLLIIMGDGKYKRELLLLKNDNILFLGHLSNPFPVFYTSDYYILTSRFEGFPNAMFEAMICGCVPISVNCSSGPYEIIMQDKNIRPICKFIKNDYGILVELGLENQVNQSLLEAMRKYTHLSHRFKKLDFQKFSDKETLFIWRSVIDNVL